MSRSETLRRVFEAAGIRNYGRWVQREAQEGAAGAALEVGTLFCAISESLLDRDDADWFDKYASSLHTRPIHASLDDAVCKIARSDCDREALVEVIRHFQAQVAFRFFGIHDGMAPASAEADDLRYRWVCESSNQVEAGGTAERAAEGGRFLPDDLYDGFSVFLEDLEAEGAIFEGE